MHSLVEDVSVLTTIPVINISQLLDKAAYCICDSVEETKLKQENLTEIDTGLGILSIFVEDNNIQYRFVPSKKLENSIKSTIVDGKNPLIGIAEKALTQKILNAYKQYL